MKDPSDTHPNHLPDSSYGLFIDNQWVSDEYGETLDNINPANGKILTNIPNATAADVDRAVQAAQRAFVTWRTTSPAERANALLKIADLLEADADRFAVLETLDVGTYREIPAHAPFGGYKKSGLGRETHKSMLEAYSQKKNIYVSLNEASLGLF